MIQTLRKNWWLLALCAVLDALYSALNFLTKHPHRSSVRQMGLLALAAGLCTVAAGFLGVPRNRSWLLTLNGLACTAFGLGLMFWTGRLSFATVALVVAVMALSMGVYELVGSRSLPFSVAGIVSIGFALAFLAFVFSLLRLNPGSPTESLLWLGSYFGFTAICMLALALKLRNDSPCYTAV